MSLITCTSECIYQKDGMCVLDRAASPGEASADGCVHYVRPERKKKAQKTGISLEGVVEAK